MEYSQYMNTIMWNKVPDYAVSVDTKVVKYPRFNSKTHVFTKSLFNFDQSICFCYFALKFLQ
jgi:hypothetical protein